MLCAIGTFQLVDIEENDRDKGNMVLVSMMILLTLLLLSVKFFAFVRKRTILSFQLEDKKYEPLEDDKGFVSSAERAEQSLQERRNKLEHLFSRSESSD